MKCICVWILINSCFKRTSIASWIVQFRCGCYLGLSWNNEKREIKRRLKSINIWIALSGQKKTGAYHRCTLDKEFRYCIHVRIHGLWTMVMWCNGNCFEPPIQILCSASFLCMLHVYGGMGVCDIYIFIYILGAAEYQLFSFLSLLNEYAYCTFVASVW